MKKIEILFAGTGGGHKSVADSIDSAIRSMDADVSVKALDGFAFLGGESDALSNLYRQIVNNAGWAYELYYLLTNGLIQNEVFKWLLMALFGDKVRQYLNKNNADLYVSCHPFFTLLMPRLVHEMTEATFMSVVTDPFTPHVHNFSDEVDVCIVSSDLSKRVALGQGVEQSKIKVIGHPISVKMKSENFCRKECLKSMGLDADKKTILISGGAEGMGNMLEIVMALSELNLPIQLVVVCGRNDELYSRVLELQGVIKIKAYKYVENFHDLMTASDILVSKPGASTMYEAFCFGLPIIMYDLVMGQEVGNMNYIVSNGAGFYCKSKKSLVEKVRDLVLNESFLQEVSLSSQALSNEDAAYNVAVECLRLVDL